ncbi:MAG: hypothetical protein NZ898_01730 [Myxococcota bacterium]|nr:hypothetical protein [Myxococcota bacterium]
MKRSDRRARPGRWSFPFVLAVVSTPHVSAQVELTGTYVDYVAVGVEGHMMNYGAARSMRWRSTPGGTTTCDTFHPGFAYHSFTIQLTSSGGTFQATNGVEGAAPLAAIPRVSGPSISGRDVTWSGRYVNGSTALTVALRYTVPADQHHVEVEAVLTNSGSVSLTEVYFRMAGDPDHGSGCPGGPGPTTRNDVRRQPPVGSWALATAGITAPISAVLGMCANDGRARVHFYPGCCTTGTAPSADWSAPSDPGDTDGDLGFAIIFREPSLAVGASTTFRFRYVWGSSVAEVESRCDAASCVEGAACSVGGVPGTCRSGSCCTGCWTGTACVSGTTPSACGSAGAACRNCNDGNLCTDDDCSAGACTFRPATGRACDDGLFCTVADACDGSGSCSGRPRDCADGIACTADMCDEGADRCASTLLGGFCLIGGSCVAAGSGDPSNACRICDPARSTSGYVPRPAGSACDDGQFCTVMDACDGSGNCTGTSRDCSDGLSCTADGCDEAGDRCAATVMAGHCIIGGLCVTEGSSDPANPCMACLPGTSATAYAPRPAGVLCGDPSCSMGMLTPAPTCDGSGSCVPGRPVPCPDGSACADPRSCASGCTDDTHCVAASYCDPEGRCVADLPEGAACERAGMCQSGFCVDGVCCDRACEGRCERCAADGAAGRCTPHADGTDPEAECPGDAVCDGSGGCHEPVRDAGVEDAAVTDAGLDAATADAAGDGGHADARRPLEVRGGGCALARAAATPDGSARSIGVLLLAAVGAMMRRRVATRRRKRRLDGHAPTEEGGFARS